MSPSAEQALDMLVPVLVIDIDIRRIDIAVVSIVPDTRLGDKDEECDEESAAITSESRIPTRPEVHRGSSDSSLCSE